MAGTRTHFSKERAPCGKLADGHRHQEADAEGLSIDDLTYACGCRRIHHVYHDGSVQIRTIHHKGKVLMDEHSGDHEA